MGDALAIIAIVERGNADHIVKMAKKAGARGATILYGRGTGEKEAKKFFNMRVESSKEAIIVLTEKENSEPIFKAMVDAGKLKETGTGIIFTTKVSNLVGLHHRDDGKFKV